jgi:hypothetical protein
MLTDLKVIKYFFLRNTVPTKQHLSRVRFLRSVRRLLVKANVVPSSPILVPLMIEAISSFETSVLKGATRRYIAEDTILHLSHPLFATFKIHHNRQYQHSGDNKFLRRQIC